MNASSVKRRLILKSLSKKKARLEKDNEKGSSREINNEKLKTEESVDCIESISISHSDQIPNLANAEQEEPLDSASENNFVSESYKVDSSTEIDDYVYDSEDSTFFNDAVDESSADENFIEVKKKKKERKGKSYLFSYVLNCQRKVKSLGDKFLHRSNNYYCSINGFEWYFSLFTSARKNFDQNKN